MKDRTMKIRKKRTERMRLVVMKKEAVIFVQGNGFGSKLPVARCCKNALRKSALQKEWE